ncbi:MAG: cell division protein ZapA [marine bacterium B5-7]|nr:MAG: cell division protein ZapA [marine bacterium B5-7]
MNDKLSFKVNIMDRDFTVACQDGEQDQLLAAAAHLDRTMRDIQRSGKVIGHERCAIMAALNVTNQFLQGVESDGLSTEADKTIESCVERIDAVLSED